MALAAIVPVAACSSPKGEAACSTAVCLDAGPPLLNCDPTATCEATNTCVGGQLYPTSCGPGNCDEALGPCSSLPDAEPADAASDAQTQGHRDAMADAKEADAHHPAEAGTEAGVEGAADAHHEAGSNLDAGASGDL